MTEPINRRAQAIAWALFCALTLWNAFDTSDPTNAAFSGVMAGAMGANAIWHAVRLREAKRSEQA